MSPSDYGPVPTARLKSESGRIFAALANGRRVLVSRHGQVVASIDPASVEAHARQLAIFALSRSDQVHEMTATTLGQGSPSEYIRLAEDGQNVWVTKNGKVYGILRRIGEEETLAEVDAREDKVSAFEREHPDATAQEFADFVASLSSLPAAPLASGPFRIIQVGEDRGEQSRSSRPHRTGVRRLKDSILNREQLGEREDDWGPEQLEEAIASLEERVESLPRLGADRELRKRLFVAKGVLERMQVTLEIGDTDQVIAKSLTPSKAALTVKHIDAAIARVVAVGSGSGKQRSFASADKLKVGDKIAYRNHGSVEVRFGPAEYVIVSRQDILDVVDRD